jgi:hypothetical protein
MVIERLAAATKTNIWIDEDALTEVGVATDAPINLKSKPISAARVLDRVLERYDLTWIIQDDVVQITTIIAAEEKLITVTYPVGDLIDYVQKHRQRESESTAQARLEKAESGGRTGVGFIEPRFTNADWLLYSLQDMTSGPWQDIDGIGGTSSYLNGNLVVRHTFKNHEEVDKIIRGIRQFTQGPLNSGTIPIRPPHYAVEEDAIVHKALTNAISVKAKDVPLNAFMMDIEETLGIPVSVDEEALSDEGVAIEEPVSLELENVPAQSVLRLALEPFGLLTRIVEDGQIRVTTTIAADERLFTKLHDIRDLDQAAFAGPDLLELLEQETSGPWQDIDGSGGVVDEPLNGLLVIRQTERVHNEVEAILADLRKKLAEALPNVENPEPVDPQAVSTKFYALDNSTDPEAVQRAILTLVEPNSWTKGGGEGEIVLIGYQLVVKHTNEVQAKVEEFLAELHKSIQANRSGLGTGFPGGSGLFHQETQSR